MPPVKQFLLGRNGPPITPINEKKLKTEPSPTFYFYVPRIPLIISINSISILDPQIWLKLSTIKILSDHQFVNILIKLGNNPIQASNFGQLTVSVEEHHLNTT